MQSMGVKSERGGRFQESGLEHAGPEQRESGCWHPARAHGVAMPLLFTAPRTEIGNHYLGVDLSRFQQRVEFGSDRF